MTPKKELPEIMKYLITDKTGKATTVCQFWKTQGVIFSYLSQKITNTSAEYNSQQASTKFSSSVFLTLKFMDLCGYLEKEMATHSSILAWKIPWMEEPDRL